MDMEPTEGKLLPQPKPISSEEVRRVFEGRGFATVANKSVSIDVYDILTPLLHILQGVQWWGEIGKLNKFLPLEITGELRCLSFSVHAAGKGQQVQIVPINTLLAILNMPKAYLEALRSYGKDSTHRAQRVEDSDYIQLENENLDTYAETLLQLLALVLPASSKEDQSKPRGDAAE
jgi:hypothetical protein